MNHPRTRRKGEFEPEGGACGPPVVARPSSAGARSRGFGSRDIVRNISAASGKHSWSATRLVVRGSEIRASLFRPKLQLAVFPITMSLRAYFGFFGGRRFVPGSRRTPPRAEPPRGRLGAPPECAQRPRGPSPWSCRDARRGRHARAGQVSTWDKIPVRRYRLVFFSFFHFFAHQVPRAGLPRMTPRRVMG